MLLVLPCPTTMDGGGGVVVSGDGGLFSLQVKKWQVILPSVTGDRCLLSSFISPTTPEGEGALVNCWFLCFSSVYQGCAEVSCIL